MAALQLSSSKESPLGWMAKWWVVVREKTCTLAFMGLEGR
jgi:hypothetical protein